MISQHSSVSSAGCKQVLALFLAVCSLNLGTEAAQAHLDSQSGVKPTPFPVCIDDSDCLKMGEGNKYACFQVRTFNISYFNSLQTCFQLLYTTFLEAFTFYISHFNTLQTCVQKISCFYSNLLETINNFTQENWLVFHIKAD